MKNTRKMSFKEINELYVECDNDVINLQNKLNIKSLEHIFWTKEKPLEGTSRVASTEFLRKFCEEHKCDPLNTVHRVMVSRYKTKDSRYKTKDSTDLQAFCSSIRTDKGIRDGVYEFTVNIENEEKSYFADFTWANPTNNIMYLVKVVELFDEDRLGDFYVEYALKNKENISEEKSQNTFNINEKGEVDKEWVDRLIENKQVIFTGAPGTGKTYSVRKTVKSLTKEKAELRGKEIKRYEFVQFHSSYDYSDFVEGLRPVPINEQNTFVRTDGIFKAFCRLIVEYNLERLRKSKEADLVQCAEINELFDACNIDDEANDIQIELKDKIKTFIDDPNHQFYFVIDEINRADIGRVCGELMFGLEESYRGVENRFKTQYANLDTYSIDVDGNYKPIKNMEGRIDVFADGFFVPENLHIVGTMNDIDRSVETFDFALRRRFQWIDIKANDVMASTLRQIFDNRSSNETRINGQKIDELINRIKAMNGIISLKDQGGRFGLNEAFHIGPAYFKEFGLPKNESNNNDDTIGYKEIWQGRIEPILREYVRGRDPQKVAEFIQACAKAFGTLDCVSDEFEDRENPQETNSDK